MANKGVEVEQACCRGGELDFGMDTMMSQGGAAMEGAPSKMGTCYRRMVAIASCSRHS